MKNLKKILVIVVIAVAALLGATKVEGAETYKFTASNTQEAAKILSIIVKEKQGACDISVPSTDITCTDVLNALDDDVLCTITSRVYLGSGVEEVEGKTYKVLQFRLKYAEGTLNVVDEFRRDYKENYVRGSERMKFYQIYERVTKIKYDFSDDNVVPYERKCSAYSGLKRGKMVCLGYAALVYRMCKTCGIDSRIVTGYTNEGIYHAWNDVKIDGKWYHCDACWDAQVPEKYWWNYLLGYEFYETHTPTEYARYGKAYSSSSTKCSYTNSKDTVGIRKVTLDKKGNVTVTLKNTAKGEKYCVYYSTKSAKKVHHNFELKGSSSNIRFKVKPGKKKIYVAVVPYNLTKWDNNIYYGKESDVVKAKAR